MRLLCPWDFPGQNTGVGCHALLQKNLMDPGIKLHLLCSCIGRQARYYWCHQVLEAKAWTRTGGWVLVPALLIVGSIVPGPFPLWASDAHWVMR